MIAHKNKFLPSVQSKWIDLHYRKLQKPRESLPVYLPPFAS